MTVGFLVKERKVCRPVGTTLTDARLYCYCACRRLWRRSGACRSCRHVPFRASVTLRWRPSSTSCETRWAAAGQAAYEDTRTLSYALVARLGKKAS